MVAVAVGEPAKVPRARVHSEGSLDVSRLHVGVRPTRTVDARGVRGEREDTCSPRVGALVPPVLDDAGDSPGHRGTRGGIEGGNPALLATDPVHRVEAASEDDLLIAGLHDHRVDLKVGGGSPGQQRAIGRCESCQVLPCHAVGLREGAADVDRRSDGRNGVDAGASDGRGEAGDEGAGGRVQCREVVTGRPVHLSERSSDVDPRPIGRCRDRLDDAVHLRGPRQQVSVGDVIGEGVGAGREARARRGACRAGVAERAHRVDAIPDHRLRPDVPRVDLDGRKRVGRRDIRRPLQQRSRRRGHVSAGRRSRGQDAAEGDCSHGEDGDEALDRLLRPALAKYGHEEISPVNSATGCPAE